MRDASDEKWDAPLTAAATFYEVRAAIGNAYTQKGSVKDTTVKSPL